MLTFYYEITITLISRIFISFTNFTGYNLQVFILLFYCTFVRLTTVFVLSGMCHLVGLHRETKWLIHVHGIFFNTTRQIKDYVYTYMYINIGKTN